MLREQARPVSPPICTRWRKASSVTGKALSTVNVGATGAALDPVLRSRMSVKSWRGGWFKAESAPRSL